MTKTKNVIIGALLVAIVAMSVGYAALAQQLDINAKSNITGTWDIEFTELSEGVLTGATTKGTPTYTATSATFEVDLAYPGATATYDITVENKGNIDARLATITGLDVANAATPTEIQYTITGIEVGDSLNAGSSTTFHIAVTWNDSDEIPTVTSKTATITLNYEQKTA